MEPAEKPGRRSEQRWEAQWQEFLQSLQAPDCAQGSPPESEAAPWDDAKAFLASFEQVAAACGWPRGEWVARLLPALSGGAQQAFSLLAAPEREDYGQVKAAILRGEALRREKRRQHFRQFCCPQLGDPRRMYSQVQELCCQWLKPERHSKEQILELLVLEQFLAGLPGDVQSRIRACGPDSGAQAVVLLEQFLLSRREDHTGTWQEPLQEWALDPLFVKEEALEMVQEKISKEPAEKFKGTQQNINEEVTVTGIADPTLLLSPEGQYVAEAELRKALGVQTEQVIHSSKADALLHVAEQTPMQPSQQTMFWNVLEEEYENMDSADDEEGTQLKVKKSRRGGKEPLETTRRERRTTQEKVPETAEVKEERREANTGQEMEPCREFGESGELTEGLGASGSDLSPVDKEGEKSSFSKYGRKYHPKSGTVSEHSGDLRKGGLLLEEKISLRSNLGQHHSSHVEEKNCDGPPLGVMLHSKSLATQQIIHPGKMTSNYHYCGRSFSHRSRLLRYQNIHTGEKPQQCPVCGKNFSLRSSLLRHQNIHTGDKPHRCHNCGRRFSLRQNLLRHERIHTGEKPYPCPECGKTFSQRSNLLTHQITHTGENPHKCLHCGKSFAHRSKLIRHEIVHTGEKPHHCDECGMSFSQRCNLLSHQKIHTGEKPHQCLDCGKSFFHTSYFLNHQKLHTGQNPHQCPDCGKSFCQRSDLVKHQKTHPE